LFCSSFCCKSNGVKETWIHTLRDCPIAKSIWHKLHILSFLNHYNKDDALWLHHNVMGSNSQLFGTACWMIWKTRNHCCFQGEEWTQIYTMNQIISQCQLIQTHFKGSSSTRDLRNVIWSATISHFVKLNTNGSFLSNPRSSSIGGIVWNSRGFWLSGF